MLYIYDLEYNMKGKFPCLQFEIYDDEFFGLTGKRVLPLSDRVKPVVIDPQQKWAYWKSVGAPGDLVMENVDFDRIIAAFFATAPR